MFGHHHKSREEEERERWMREEELRHHHHPPPPPVHHHQQPPLPIHNYQPPHQPHGGYDPYPPAYPAVQHVSHEVYPPPAAAPHNQPPHQTQAHGGYAPHQPVYPSVQHVSHEVYPPAAAANHNQPPHQTQAHGGYAPHQPAYPSVQHVSHEVYRPPPVGPYGGALPGHSASSTHHDPRSWFSNKRTVRVFPKAGQGYALSIRNGKVILATANPRDEYQHWIKDEKYSTKVKDKDGQPSFALVNKVTGEAIKHSIGQEHPVRLIHYNPDYLDESVLWTESKDSKDGFRSIRMVNNINLAFDAFHGDKDHGGVHDGTTVVLWESWKGDNQIWKIVPYCK